MYKSQAQEKLIAAVEQGDLDEVVTSVNKGAKIYEIPWGTESLLMRAIRCQHPHVAEYLINIGIDVNYIYVKSDSPRGVTNDVRRETAMDYAEFYKMPQIAELIKAKQGL